MHALVVAWVVVLQVIDPGQLFEWLTKYGAAGVLAFLVVAFMLGWIVPGYANKQKDADISTLRAAVDALQKELTEQIKVNAQAAAMAGRLKDVARVAVAEALAGRLGG